MPSLPYSFGEDTPPAGAIRAMMRSPAPAAVPLPIPRVRQSYAVPMRYDQPMPLSDMAQPNWKTENPWGDLFRQGVDAASKFGDKSGSDTFKNLDAALEDLKKQRLEFATAMGKLNSPRASDSGTPADLDSYRRGVRSIESDADDQAVNPLTIATGRYQFLPSTAKALMDANPALGLRMEDLKKPDVQEKLMELYTDISLKTLEPMLGRKPTAGELYMLHLLGHGGGPTVLRNLDAPITDTISQPARDSNKVLLGPHKTGRQLLAAFDKRFGVQ